jgi:hypothetical protein
VPHGHRRGSGQRLPHTGADGRMVDPGIVSACLDGAWMTVVGLGGITSGAGGEHRAARVDAKRMGHGGGEASGQGMGGGDNLRPRQVGGGGMVVRVVYTIVLINSRDYLSV